MNRVLTNFCRFVMDECVPSVIRDSKVFMYPFYYFAYRGKNLDQAMNFKTLVQSWTPEEYAKFYRELDTISRHRETDLNGSCVKRILRAIPPDTHTLIDVGCGHGFLLKKILERFPSIEAVGCDLKAPNDSAEFRYLQGDLFEHRLPDRAFDVVTCCHTLEHLLQPEKYVRELIRIAKRQLIIVVPCQRYYFYTLDEHVNFFPSRVSLTSLIGLKEFECEKVFGDWFYVATLPR